MSDNGAPSDRMPAPPERTPLHDIAWFLEWCRLRGYRVGPLLEYGGVRMQVEDLRQHGIEGTARSLDDGMSEDFKIVTGSED